MEPVSAALATKSRDFVSVVMPLYNEQKYIEATIHSLLRQTYPIDMFEIICVDGNSTDETVAILSKCAASNANLMVIHNPFKKTATSLNIGIRAATGKYIVRVDGHSVYPDNYIQTLVGEYRSLGAANVGTVCYTKSLNNSLVGVAASFVLSCPFGVGNSRFRLGVKSITEVDTVPFGCYDRRIFDEIGYFDERLHRTEDYEFNQRLRRAGGRIFLLPEPGLTFYTRDHLGELLTKQFGNGYGVAETAVLFKLSGSVAYRHFVPLLFVMYLSVALILLLLWSPIAMLPLLLYLMIDAYFCMKAAQTVRSAAIAACAFILFPLVHIAYGLGSLYGLFCSLKAQLA